ncbi:MAG TPA: histidine phosphatase family protein [Polyangiaceae bacterium]
MLISIFRHGIAEDAGLHGPRDPERALTPEGIQRTREAALGLKALELLPDAIFTSPYVRARQTAELAALAFGKKTPTLTITDALLPSADPAHLYGELAGRGCEQPLCVGHAPHLDLFIGYLLGASASVTELKKAGLACVEVNDPPMRGGILLGLYPPRVLRALG